MIKGGVQLGEVHPHRNIDIAMMGMGKALLPMMRGCLTSVGLQATSPSLTSGAAPPRQLAVQSIHQAAVHQAALAVLPPPPSLLVMQQWPMRGRERAGPLLRRRTG